MEEEKCPVSVRQHFVLYNARSLSYSASVYSFKEGAVSLINYPPNKSNYLGSLLYLILYYIHQRARTREGPVPTLHTPIGLGDGFLHDNRVLSDWEPSILLLYRCSLQALGRLPLLCGKLECFR